MRVGSKPIFSFNFSTRYLIDSYFSHFSDLVSDEPVLQYVKALNKICPKVKDLGGDILVTTTQKKQEFPCGEEDQVTVIRDSYNSLAKLFSIPYAKLTTREKMAKLTSRLRGSTSTPAQTPIDFDQFEELLPGIVIVKGQTGEEMFKWTGEHHLWQKGKKLDALDIVRVVSFCKLITCTMF
jgi:hypothetical protein